MARTHSRPSAAGIAPLSPPDDMLSGIHADAERASLALASLMELLQGCAPGYQISAGALLCLLEPVAAGLDMVRGDLRTAARLCH